MKLIFYGQRISYTTKVRNLVQGRKNNHQFKIKNYLNSQVIFSILLLTGFTAWFPVLGTADKLCIATIIVLTLINCGALMEQRKYIYELECVRIILLLSYLLWKAGLLEWVVLPAIAMLLMEQYFQLSKLYYRYVLRDETLY